MSNSPLVAYTRISPNRTPGRTHAIDTVTIHCVVGQCTAETLGAVFADASRRASSNYGVGKDGRIGMYVAECDRSWCSSNSANDARAVTIEVASDTYHPYAVTDAAYKATIKLVADICKRNGIKKLVWSTNKGERVNHVNGCNMTVHRDYANKACPGDYLYSRMGDIAAKVNAMLDGGDTPVEPEPESDDPAITIRGHKLKEGAYGPRVKKLQTILNAFGYNCGTVDGEFGAKTKAAVAAFQADNGITPGGVMGANTWRKLIG